MNPIAIKDTFNAGKTFAWHSGDTEENWKQACKRFGSTWYYYDNPIDYTFNELGYRSSRADIDKFFLAYGCSHTMGVGIHLEDTYCEVLSKDLKLSYLNFGMPGSAQNLLWANTVLWNKNAQAVPEFVILQWPEVERLTTWTNDRINLFLPNHAGDKYTSKHEQKMFHNMLASEDYMDMQARMYFESTNLIWKQRGVPVINFTLSAKVGELFNIKCFKGWTINEQLAARDLLHPGIVHNIDFAEYIKEQL